MPPLPSSFSASRRTRISKGPISMPTSSFAALGVALLLVTAGVLHYQLSRPSTTGGDDKNVEQPRRRSTSFSLHRNKNNQKSNPAPDDRAASGDHHHHHRIAIILPYAVSVSPSSPQQEEQQSTTSSEQQHHAAPPLSYWNVFCAGAAGAAPVADFLIFHTGVAELLWPAVAADCPANVRFIDLQSHRALATRLVDRVLDATPEQEWKLDRDTLAAFLASYLQAKPYALVEFKPALGHVFQDYLTAGGDEQHTYSHWGYSDLDILFGDLGRWITADEWSDYDIVTYTFGDQQRLYLRGQFTFHRNDRDTINQLWRPCDYLSRMDVRFAELLEHGTDRYRPESAEGCYSAAVLERTDVAVKFAAKAWTDIYSDDPAYSHGVFLARSQSSQQQQQQPQQHVLYKVNAEHMAGAAQVSLLPPAWFFEPNAVYQDDAEHNHPIQYETGERTRLDLDRDADPAANCMYWARPKYQTRLCLKDGIVSRDDTVVWSRGALYKQRYANAALGGDDSDSDDTSASAAVATAPFFHFQEWKRSYRFEQVASLHPSSAVEIFALVPEGAIPMIDIGGGLSSSAKKKKTTIRRVAADAAAVTTAQASSPLGWSNMEQWQVVENNNSDSRQDQLPGNLYCLVSGVDMFEQRSECQSAVSWQSNSTTTILAGAPGWTSVNPEADVTLVLTLQIGAAQAQSPRALHRVVDHLLVSLNRWQGQPSVVVIAVSTTPTQTTLDLLAEKFNADDTKARLQRSLIAVVAHPTMVSRKALLNMAADAAPTRWSLAGLEVERGLSVSADAAFLAHRTAAAHRHLRARVFLVPQLGLLPSSTSSSSAAGGGDGDNNDANKGASSSSASAADDDVEVQDTIADLHRARRERKLKSLAAFDATCDEDDIPGGDNRLASAVESIWWTESHFLLSASSAAAAGADANGRLARRAAALEDLERALLELGRGSDDENPLSDLDESPLVLVDNLGPHEGLRTSEIAREVEALGGPRCLNGLRLKQLAVLGYSFDVLVGAFALSSASSRRAAAGQSGGSDPAAAAAAAAAAAEASTASRCDACTMFNKKHEDILVNMAKVENRRAAKAAILWAESLGLKQ